VPGPAAVGRTCCQTEQIVGLLVAAAVEEELLTAVCPGTAVEEQA